MIFTPNPKLSIHVSLIPIDMRKAINGLSALVIDIFEKPASCGDLFIFYNRARDKVKLLHWDKNGFGLYYKRLEKGKFKFKKDGDDVIEISQDQLSWLLAGLDFILMDEFSELNYSDYC